MRLILTGKTNLNLNNDVKYTETLAMTTIIFPTLFDLTPAKLLDETKFGAF